MKLAILTQYYPPEMGAPQARLSELATRLVKAGHEVTVITAMPNYPTGRILPGYGGLIRRETMDGVRVIRTFIYPTQSAGMVRRLANYFSFVVSSALIGTFLLRRHDFLMAESPPLFLGMSGWWLARVARARLIFNVSDLWPESAVSLGVVRAGSATHRLAARLEAWCYGRAWCVTGQSRGILRSIQDRFPTVRTYHLTNGVDTMAFTPDRSTAAARDRMRGSNDQIVAAYAGLHGLAQGLDQVVEAAARISGDARGVRFVLIGDGAEKAMLQVMARERGATNIEFMDPQPKAELPALLASADIVLVTLKHEIPGAVPSKLYEAMATGRPVVLVATGEPAAILEQARGGIAVDPGDVEGFVAALRRLRDNESLRRELGANGRRAAVEHFDREGIVSRFESFLSDALSRGAN